METRLRWGGNQQAQAIADAAFARLRPKKKKPKKAKKTSQRKHNPPKPKKKLTYREYIDSKAWAGRRKQLFQRRGKRCERCGSEHDIQVHHLSYKRLGREKDRDLEILCRGCHLNEHEGKGGVVMDPMTEAYLSAIGKR